MTQRNSERLTIEDCRRAGHCVRGVRDWFAAHDLDFRAFLKDGIALETIEVMHDGYGDQIIARKRAREASGGG